MRFGCKRRGVSRPAKPGLSRSFPNKSRVDNALRGPGRIQGSVSGSDKLFGARETGLLIHPKKEPFMKHPRLKSLAVLAAAVCLSCGVVNAEVRVASDDALKAAVKKIAPDYPPVAKQMRIAGKVSVEVVIDAEGNVEDARILSGNALLTPSVVNAVKKWKFTPFTGPGGEATKAVATIDIDFKL
jgi:TonB family protein